MASSPPTVAQDSPASPWRRDAFGVLVGAKLPPLDVERLRAERVEVQSDIQLLCRRAVEEPTWLLLLDQELSEPYLRCAAEVRSQGARTAPTVLLAPGTVVSSVTRYVGALRALRDAPVQTGLRGSPEDFALVALMICVDTQAAGSRQEAPAPSDPLSLLVRPRSAEDAKRAQVEALNAAFRERERLLAASLGTQEVAQLLGVTRQTPHDRVKAGALLAVEDSKGALRFPLWQFDPDGPGGVVKGLPEVLRALQVGKFAQVRWLERPSPVLEGRSPLDALKAGDVERVVQEARSLGASAGNG